MSREPATLSTLVPLFEELMKHDLTDGEINAIQSRFGAYAPGMGLDHPSNVRFLKSVKFDMARLIGSLIRERMLLREIADAIRARGEG